MINPYQSKDLSVHTDSVFRKELNRATTTLVDYLKNEETEQRVLSGLENLREVIDDSFQDKGIFQAKSTDIRIMSPAEGLIYSNSRCSEAYLKKFSSDKASFYQ